MIPNAVAHVACALEAYGLRDAAVEQLSDVDCAVFRVHGVAIDGCEPGRPAILKIYPEHKRDAGAIEAEVDWLQALRRDTALRVPKPIPARDGSLIQDIGTDLFAGRRSVLFTWVDGHSVDGGLTPARLRGVGAFVGALHGHSEHWDCVSKRRLTRQTFTQRAIRWILEMGAPPPTVSADEWSVLLRAAERLRGDIAAIGEDRDVYGFVHSDLYLSNFLFDGDAVGVIDFSDCAWGHYADDIASVLVFLKHPFVGNFDHSPQYARLRDAFLDGYQSTRPLPRQLPAILATYFAARIFLVWTYVHEASATVSWVPGCVAHSRQYLESYCSAPLSISI